MDPIQNHFCSIQMLYVVKEGKKSTSSSLSQLFSRISPLLHKFEIFPNLTRRFHYFFHYSTHHRVIKRLDEQKTTSAIEFVKIWGKEDLPLKKEEMKGLIQSCRSAYNSLGKQFQTISVNKTTARILMRKNPLLYLFLETAVQDSPLVIKAMVCSSLEIFNGANRSYEKEWRKKILAFLNEQIIQYPRRFNHLTLKQKKNLQPLLRTDLPSNTSLTWWEMTVEKEFNNSGFCVFTGC